MMDDFGVILAVWLGLGGLGTLIGLCGLSAAGRRLRTQWPLAMENESFMRETATSVVAAPEPVLVARESLVASH